MGFKADESIIEASKKYDSQSNGFAERTVETVVGQVRAMMTRIVGETICPGTCCCPGVRVFVSSAAFFAARLGKLGLRVHQQDRRNSLESERCQTSWLTVEKSRSFQRTGHWILGILCNHCIGATKEK